MKCKKEFEFKKAIIVDSNMLLQLDEEIKKLCDDITYKAELVNGDELTFDSLDELINYENSKDNYLRKIIIWARERKQYINDISVYISQSDYDSPSLYETVRVVLTTDNIDKVTVFQQRIEHICDRHSQDKRYQFFSKTGMFSKLGYVSWGMFVACLVILHGQKNFMNTGFFLIVVMCSLYLILVTPIVKAKKKYYPPIVFYLGDGIKNYDEQKNSRNNFFWTVCIGGTISIILFVLGLVI